MNAYENYHICKYVKGLMYDVYWNNLKIGTLIIEFNVHILLCIVYKQKSHS